MLSFIGQYVIDDVSVCDELIEYHKNSNLKTIGQTSNGISPVEKISTDVTVDINGNHEVVNKYLTELEKVCNKYVDQYKFCNEYDPWKITENINIQHYKPNEGYFEWHTERCSNTFPVNSRHLAFMTYLNDVNDGGETEFYYQELKIKPVKGLTLIWPVDWTHTHRGVTSPTEEKYIITGWYNFTDRK